MFTPLSPGKIFNRGFSLPYTKSFRYKGNADRTGAHSAITFTVEGERDLGMSKDNKTVYSFPKNPTEEIRASLSSYKNKQYLDLRIYYLGDDDEYHPSKKGITLSPDLLGELEEAVRKLREVVGED